MNETTLNEYPPDLLFEALAPRGMAWTTRFIKTVDNWNRRYRRRRQFAAAEARVLNDIGISQASRFIEVNKPFWEQ
jgi:uncharacterized protein YjiS (DUF1127 family)